MPNALTPVGPDIQVNTGPGNHVTGNQNFPDITLLPDGRFIVIYQSENQGNVNDNDPIVAIFNPNGTISVASQDFFSPGAQQTAPAIAARPGGGFGVVVQNQI